MSEPMRKADFPLGFRIAGSARGGDRRLVEYDRAFAAYAACDDAADVSGESYLSPFQYADNIRERVIDDGGRLDVSGFDGPVWSSFLWFDIDRDGDIPTATDDARNLAALLVDRYDLNDGDLLLFFSGSKGYHLGLPMSLFDAVPSTAFDVTSRTIAEALAASVGVVIDPAIYQKVQPLRAPNSRHGKTGRHKRFLTFDELMGVRPDAIVDRAAEPLPFEIPDAPAAVDHAAADWRAAERRARTQAEAVRVEAAERTELNRSTIDFIRDGADDGERQRRLYSAAANVRELGGPLRLAVALLNEPALDVGLPPGEIHRTIKSAYRRGGAA